MHSHKILRVFPPNIPLQNSLSKALGISKILAQILINRGLSNAAEAKRFLHTATDQFNNPYSFSDMHKAVGLVKKTSLNKGRVMVFGDYDVDGITSLVLLKDTLKKLNLDVEHYLPHRTKEGYGLTRNILHLTKEKNISLLITADCGISNHREIEELTRHNIDVIVTDHHEPVGMYLPRAACIINPKVKDSGYKFRDLAGVGVAFKFCQALAGSRLLEDLDLVALGTIADSVPLTGENRLIAKEGLVRLSKTKRPGLRALIESAGVKEGRFDATCVSFMLAPRINASGRMDTAETSLNLLMSRTREDADGFAKIIEAHNRQRQKVESSILEEAHDLISSQINFKEHKVIVIAKEDWHHGVLGIVAAKIADKFYRPSIVISVGADSCKGSARSIKNFHIFEALLDCKELLNSFGGHAHAAGLVINKDNIEGFRNTINRLAHERLSVEDLLPGLDIDMELSLSCLNEEIIAQLKELEPFGSGNPEPLFYTRGLRIKGEPRTLARGTLKFWVTDGSVTFQAIGFSMSSLKDNFAQDSSFDLVYYPRIDDWGGSSSVLLEVRDVFFR